VSIRAATERARLAISQPAFGWFVLAGASGFVVDAGILTLLMRIAGLPLMAARAVSFSCAVTVTWLINRNVAFARRARPRVSREYVGYVLIQVFGAVINFGVFAACIALLPALAAWPVVPLAAGAAVALLFNFVAAQSVLYPDRASCVSPQE
jgi:putative flippase GtrA